MQITLDCRVKEELGMGRDEIKMLSARCSLQHLSNQMFVSELEPCLSLLGNKF